MTVLPDVSGSFRRPTLIDYLVVLDTQSTRIGLRAWIGALEVGFIGVADGRPLIAEIPGARGDTALTLLARLPAARILPECWSPPQAPLPAKIEHPWRELVDLSDWEASPGRSQRLADVRAELVEFVDEGHDSPELMPTTESLRRESDLVAELMNWAAIEAYLSGSLDEARELIACGESARPGDLVCAANLERLRLRMLEDEITASVRGAGQRLG